MLCGKKDIWSRPYTSKINISIIVSMIYKQGTQRKTKKTHLHIQEHSTFYIDNVHRRSIKRKHTQTCPMVELYICCFMNKQYIKGVQNGKNLNWQLLKISPYGFTIVWDNRLYCLKNRHKKVKEGFLRLSLLHLAT